MVLLVDGPDAAAAVVVGALRVTVVTVAVVVDTMTTVVFIFGVVTVVGLVVSTRYGSVTSMDFEVEARTVDVAAVTTSVDDVRVALSFVDVAVVTVSSSEIITASWNPHSISGTIADVIVAGAVDCRALAASSSAV